MAFRTVPVSGPPAGPLVVGRSAIRRVGGASVILKLLEGTQGMGVILAESVKSAESVLDAMSTLRQNILIQAFIEEAWTPAT